MATVAGAHDGRAFSISTIIGRAFGVLADNPVPTFGIAFLLGALPQLLFQFFVVPAQPTAPGEFLAYILLSLGSIPVSLFLMALVQSALIRATISYTRGERASFAECIATGLPKVLPLIGLMTLMTLALMLGFMLLIVPGIILYLVWSVACPALVAENLGVVEAFGRSATLTKGARWRIFGLFLLLVLTLWMLALIPSFTMLLSGDLQTAAAQMANGRLPILYLLLSTVIATLSNAIWASIQTSLYVALREWKEGPQSEALADVFA